MGGKANKKRGGGSGGGVAKAGGGGSGHMSEAAAAAAADALREQVEADEEEDEDEVAPLGRRTRNAALQAKLDTLAALASAGRIREMCAAFVPLDLSAADAAEFAAGLETDEERWQVLAAELQVLASGSGVRRIIGDQVTRAEFHYAMPGRTFINREVVFVNTGGDWRAEG